MVRNQSSRDLLAGHCQSANNVVQRHPFPGPGIAIRILGEVTPERVAIARAADNIFISMIKEAGIYDQVR